MPGELALAILFAFLGIAVAAAFISGVKAGSQ